MTAPVDRARELLASYEFTPRPDAWLRGYDLAFSRAMAERGLIGLTWPTSAGGGGYSNVDRLAVTEELLRAGAPVAAHWIGDRQIGPSILRHGTPELQAELLPGIIRADLTFCLGMSEPQAGSDLAAVRTRATRVEGGWLLNGHKIWTSGAHRATHLYVLARTSEGERKHDGLSELLVDMGPGITVSPIRDLTGEHHFNEVLLQDVFVPAHRLLGVEGRGWQQVVEQLAFERGGPERFLSTYVLFAAILDALRGVEPAPHAGLGRLVARLAVLRRLARRTALALDEGQAPVREAATTKYLGNAFELDVVEFVRELPPPARDAVAELYRASLLASPGFALRGGSRDVLLGLLARETGPR
ncbi:acyl-CoA dehydrogenase family protein [Cryptosporangium sp. NPDC051539]|uniref:acyl-CoA dehydrogenase family protein n=1 Tax=Cryptosporangium sp. NPDC051539 TaxID=3363962 RepID=UPI00378E3A5E